MNEDEIRLSEKGEARETIFISPEEAPIKIVDKAAPRLPWLAGIALLVAALAGLLLWQATGAQGSQNPLPPGAEALPPLAPASAPGPAYRVRQWVLDADMLEVITRGGIHSDSIPWQTVKEIEHLLSWSIGIRSLRQGDTLRIAWRLLDDSTAGPLSGVFIYAQARKGALYAFAYEAGGKPGYYDEDGRPWKRRFLQSPVKYGVISSRFNLLRLNPVLKIVKPHRGTDFAAPEGAEIFSLADGIVTQMRRSTVGNGNHVTVQHDSIFKTTYLHMQDFAKGMKEGDSVQQGEVIGYVGRSGSTSGPHVCLRFWRRDFQDDFVGAFPYLPKPDPLPPPAMRGFRARRDSLLTLLRPVR